MSRFVPPDEKSKWIHVRWMPHASLSQTSHVCLLIRSAQLLFHNRDNDSAEAWRVHVSLFGVAGVQLAPIISSTPAAPLEPITESLQIEEEKKQRKRNPGGPLKQQPRRHPLVADATHQCLWDFVVQVPIRWRDLPRDAYLRFEITNSSDTVLHNAILPFFNCYGRLHTGMKRIDLSGDAGLKPYQNQGLEPPKYDEKDDDGVQEDPVWDASCILDQLDRFGESRSTNIPSIGSTKAFGHTPSVPWLDQLTREHCEGILDEAKEQMKTGLAGSTRESVKYLIVELPQFDVPIMHEETNYPIPSQGTSGAVTPLQFSLHQQQKSAKGDNAPFNSLDMIPFLDYENENDNPVEDKYRTMAHDLLRGLVDPALKPDRTQRDQLAAIIASPSHHPSREEKDLLWRFRFSLVDNNRALTKFLLAVDWTVESEVVQAAELLEQWRKRSPIEVTDALKLLGKQVAYQTNLVRTYAIETLQAAPDDELRLYLLQLVQALKFENIQELGVTSPTASTAPVSSLASFLIDRAAKNMHLANYLYWYLKVEIQDPTHGTRYQEVFAEMEHKLSQVPFTTPDPLRSISLLDESEQKTQASDGANDSKLKPFTSIVDSVSKLGVSLRGSDKPTGEKSQASPSLTMWEVLSNQDALISGIMDIQMQSRDSKGKKDAKEAQLRSLLSKEGYAEKREPVPLPTSPSIMVNSVNVDNAKIFKSAVYPALVEFHIDHITDTGDSDVNHGGVRKAPQTTKSQSGSNLVYRAIVKTGDDLRQDQLVIMMTQLMDGLLKRASLDLCLSPYSIIATSPTAGLVEFVDGSMPVSAILASHNNSILQFFQSCAPHPNSKYKVRPEVMSSYVRSCAGYCVLTYILGVGDRHLDNILITKTGRFFHIDFGYCFGRDPKPLPPAFRLTYEMVDGMGGLKSTEYQQFRSLACQAFNTLRKSAGLVLNLLHLMSDAGIEDLSNNPSADADGVIEKVEERLRLNMTDDQAERYFLELIDGSLSALAPRLMDVFHSIAVARR